MENPMKKFRQNSIVFEKPGTLSEKLKTLTSSNYHRVKYFLLKFCTRFLLTNVYERVFFIKNWRSKKSTKKNNENLFVDIAM